MGRVEAKDAQRRRPELKVLALLDRQSDPAGRQAAAELAMENSAMFPPSRQRRAMSRSARFDMSPGLSPPGQPSR